VRRWIKKHGAITMSLTLWDIEDLVCQVAESADWKRFFSAGDDLPKTDNKIDSMRSWLENLNEQPQ